MSPELTVGIVVALTGFIPVLVAGVIKLLDWFRNRKAQTHEQQRQGHQDRLAEFSTLFDRMQEELDAKGRQLGALDRKLNNTLDRAAECERREARCEARMEYYEAVMLAAGLKFRPWSEVDADHDAPPAPEPPVTP